LAPHGSPLNEGEEGVMGRLKRIWLAGALVVVVAAVAAPAGAQTSATQADWQREWVRIGGTFSITDLGGPKVVDEFTGVRGFRGPPAFTNPAQELVNICDEFPDSKKSDASFAIASGIGMARCMRDGVANIKETRVLKATRSPTPLRHRNVYNPLFISA